MTALPPIPWGEAWIVQLTVLVTGVFGTCLYLLYWDLRDDLRRLKREREQDQRKHGGRHAQCVPRRPPEDGAGYRWVCSACGDVGNWRYQTYDDVDADRNTHSERTGCDQYWTTIQRWPQTIFQTVRGPASRALAMTTNS